MYSGICIFKTRLCITDFIICKELGLKISVQIIQVFAF